MLAVHSSVPLLRRAPKVLALSLVLVFVASGCGELSEPTSTEPAISFDLSEQEMLGEQEMLDLVMTADDPRALRLPTIQLSENGADLFGVGGGKSSFGTQNDFDLSAHTGPRGDFGHYGVKVYNPITGQQIVSYRVDVRCVHMHVPDRGVIKGVVEKVEPVPNALDVTLGETLTLLIEDGGEPSSGPLDDFIALNTDLLPLLSCKNIFWEGDLNNVTQGNVRVKMN
jgi:hypothetical protein